METLLIFLFFFGLFAWGMWKLLRFTRDTVGENSPLKVQRVYQISGLRYFLGFDGINAIFLALLGVILIFQLTTIPFTISLSYPSLMYVLIGLVLFMLFGGSTLVFALLINHWPYANGVIIVTHPADHAIEITIHGRTLTVLKGNIERIESVYSTSKAGYAYSTYFLVNGESFILSSRVPGQDVIREYFPETPISGSYSQYGFIS
ncbi:MAG: hypothetical protein KKG00_12415 [Bacteroidetes bacterium]|nr:hypothetical protein [Bacteroidota bacterium]